MSAHLHEVAVLHRLSVADYYRMGEAGILGPELRTELIQGEIIEMTPIGPGHGGAVNLIGSRLRDVLTDSVVLAIQNPVRLDDFSEPQPDLVLLRPREDFYRDAHPRPADVLLLIEVCDSTLRYDREVKLPLYARAGIPEAWLVDLRGRALSIHRRPGGECYAESEVVADLGALPLPSPPGGSVDLSGLF